MQLTTARLSAKPGMNLLQRYTAWDHSREQRLLEHWALERTKGKTRFVLHEAFKFTVFLAAYFDVTGHFSGRSDNMFSFWLYMGLYVAGGLFGGYMEWASREGKYKKALLNGSLQRPFDDRLIPH